MTIFQKVLSGRLYIGALAVTLLLASCLKNKNNENDPVAAAALSVVNASSSYSAMDFYLDRQKVTASSIPYTQNTPYFYVYSGVRQVDITNGGSISSLASGNINFVNGKFYTLFLTRKATTAGVDSARAVLYEDDLTAPADNKAKIRFINLTTGSPAVDVVIRSTNTALVTNRAFAAPSNFAQIDTASALNLDVREAGSNVVKYTIGPIPIVSKKIYTIWTSGLWNGSSSDNTAPGGRVIINNP